MGRNPLHLCVLLCAMSLSACWMEEAVGPLAVDHRLRELFYRDCACAEAIS